MNKVSISFKLKQSENLTKSIYFKLLNCYLIKNSQNHYCLQKLKSQKCNTKGVQIQQGCQKLKKKS